MNGRCTAQHLLDNSGHYILPAGKWMKGVYMLRFEGEQTIAMKIMK
jgi:hypothetical protein